MFASTNSIDAKNPIIPFIFVVLAAFGDPVELVRTLDDDELGGREVDLVDVEINVKPEDTTVMTVTGADVV